MPARYVLALPLVAFAITLGIVIGQRLSHEAMIVIVGVVAGIAASIPTSLLTTWIAARRSTPPVQAVPPTPRPAAPEEPHVIVVQTSPPSSASHAAQVPLYTEPARAPRQFNVIGGADDLS